MDRREELDTLVISAAIDTANLRIDTCLAQGGSLVGTRTAAVARATCYALAEYECERGDRWSDVEWTCAALSAVETITNPNRIASVLADHIAWPERAETISR